MVKLMLAIIDFSSRWSQNFKYFKIPSTVFYTWSIDRDENPRSTGNGRLYDGLLEESREHWKKSIRINDVSVIYSIKQSIFLYRSSNFFFSRFNEH